MRVHARHRDGAPPADAPRGTSIAQRLSGKGDWNMPTYRTVDDAVASRLGWFALGLLSGAAIAFLTSPHSGRENRQILRRRVREVGDYVTEEGGVFVDAQRRVNDVVERGRHEVHAFSSRVTDAVEHGKTAAKTAREQLNHTVSEVAAAGREVVDKLAGHDH